MDFLIDLDTRIFLFFNGMHTSLLDTFMMLFTGRFIWVPMYLAIAMLMLKTFGKRLTLIYLVAIGVAITATDQTCATLIRPYVERLRPSNLENPLSQLAIVVDGYRGGSFGFPSCHAANSFALATFVTLLLRRRRLSWAIFIWAALNSYSRLYLGVHYPGDLLVGAAIGSFYGAAFYLVARRFTPWQRRESLQRLGRPLFYLPSRLQLAGAHSMGIGITAGDLAIGVGVLTVAFILAVSIMG